MSSEPCEATWGVDGSGIAYRCDKPKGHPPGRHEYNGNGWQVWWHGQIGVHHLGEVPPDARVDVTGDTDPDLTGPSMKYCTNVYLCAEFGEGCLCSTAERRAKRDATHNAGDPL